MTSVVADGGEVCGAAEAAAAEPLVPVELLQPQRRAGEAIAKRIRLVRRPATSAA
jgi:hypothetical protein